MINAKSRKIEFIQKGTSSESRKRIDFVPSEAAQRLRRSNYSNVNELKSYLNPRGYKY